MNRMKIFQLIVGRKLRYYKKKNIRIVLLSALPLLLVGLAVLFGVAVGSFFAPQNEAMHKGSYYLISGQDIDEGELATNNKVIGLAKQKYQRIQSIIEANSGRVDPSLLALSENPIVSEGGREMVQTNGSIGKWAVENYRASSEPREGSLRPLGLASQSTRIYQATPRGGVLSMYVNGRDPVVHSEKQSDVFSSQAPLILDESVLRPYITTSLNTVSADEIPILLPMSELRSIGLISQISRTNNFEDMIREARQMATQASGKTVEACFRSDYEMTLLQQALADEKGSSNLARTDCASLADTKDLVSKKVADELGSNTKVSVQKVRFRVVGVLPDISWYASQTTDQLTSMFSMLRAGTINAAVIPAGSSSAKLNQDMFIASSTVTMGTRHKMTLERFDSQKDLIETYQKFSCPTVSQRCTHGTYRLSEVGTNIISTTDVLSKISNVTVSIAIIVALVSLVVISMTYINLVTDDGKEIVLLRTLGMKRWHMSGVYTAYFGILFTVSSVTVYVFSYLLVGVLGWLLSDKLQAIQYFVYGLVGPSSGFELGRVFGGTWLWLALVLVGLLVLVQTVVVLRTLKQFNVCTESVDQ